MLEQLIRDKQTTDTLRKHKVLVAYLFGSLAGGKDTALSDVDIAVVVDDEVRTEQFFDIKIKLTTELIKRVKRNDVDIVIINEAPPLLRYKIISQGDVFFCADESRRIREEVRAMRDYFDVQELLKVRNMYFIDRVTRGKFADLS